LKFDYWNDRSSGVQRSNPIISVERLDLLGSKQDNEQGGGNMGGGYPDEF
jgi:single-strand DNA-binding protein